MGEEKKRSVTYWSNDPRHHIYQSSRGRNESHLRCVRSFDRLQQLSSVG